MGSSRSITGNSTRGQNVALTYLPWRTSLFRVAAILADGAAKAEVSDFAKQ